MRKQHYTAEIPVSNPYNIGRVRGSGIQYPSGIQRRKTTEERGFRIHDRPGDLSGISRMAARSRTQGARQRRHGAPAHVHDGQQADENFQPVTTVRPDSDTTQPRLRLTQDEKTTPRQGVVFSKSEGRPLPVTADRPRCFR